MGSSDLKPKYGIKISKSARNNFPHIQEGALEELLCRHIFAFACAYTQLGSENIACPEQCSSSGSVYRNFWRVKYPYAIVAAESFW